MPKATMDAPYGAGARCHVDSPDRAYEAVVTSSWEREQHSPIQRTDAAGDRPARPVLRPGFAAWQH